MNILYINTHDTGRMISPYGYQVKTDHLLELAKEGTLFTHAFCCGPTCSPSRAALLTGVYPHQNGMLGLAQRGFSLEDASKHLANILKLNGYKTVLSGIQHELGWYLDKDEAGLNKLGYDTILTREALSYNKEDLHLWDEKNAEAIVEWIESYEEHQPFLISYGLHSTHRPYPIEISNDIDERFVVPPYPIHNNEANRRDHAQYLTSATNADNSIGLVIKALKEKGLYDSTIIIYTTDHGLALPYHKCNLSDTGIGVGLIVRVPHAKSCGKVYDGLISHIDVVPTVMELLNLEVPNYCVGKSFKSSFEDISVKINEAIFAEVNFHTSYEPMRAIRTERYKYCRYYDQSWLKINCSNIDESAPKNFLMDYDLSKQRKEKEQLYDLYFDPIEHHNLANDPDFEMIKQGLAKQLESIQRSTNDPLLNGHLPILKHYKVNKASCLMASSKDPNDYDANGHF